MPRKTLIQNGWLGGINKDGDLSDIKSEDRQGKNELSVCNDAICNQPGKISIKSTAIKFGTSDGDAKDGGNTHDITLNTDATAGETDDFLIHGEEYYRHQGIYKLGEDVEYSGKNDLTRPTSITFGSKAAPRGIQDDSIGLDANVRGSRDDVDYLFLGKKASESIGDALVANVSVLPGTSDRKSNQFIMGVRERIQRVGNTWMNHPNSYWSGVADWSLDDAETAMTFGAIMGYGDNMSGLQVALWDDDVTATQPSSGTGSDQDDWTDGHVWHGDTGEVGAGVGSPTVDSWNYDTSDVSIADTDYIRFGRTSNTDHVALSSDTYEQYVRRGDFGITFGVGEQKVSGSVYAKGLYSEFTGMDINGKDIYVDIQINGSISAFWTHLAKVNIIADCDKDNLSYVWRVAYADPTIKIWAITKDELSSKGAVAATNDAAAEGVRIKIPWESALFTGSSFSASDVRQISIWFECIESPGIYDAFPDATANTTAWLARLFEISFTTSDNVGWANQEILFSQSRVLESDSKNRIESLPQKYTNTLTTTSVDSVVSLDIYQPNDANYKGNIYYQTADAAGNGVGSLFLLANVDNADGVKSILSDFYVPWDSFTITGCTWEGANLSKIICTVPDNLKVGMRVTGAGVTDPYPPVPTDTKVSSIDVSGAFFLISNAMPSAEASASVLTISGKVQLYITDPPVSSTYQLESGYPQDTETINALWDHAAVVGRQIYVGSVIKTGDDIRMESSSGSPLPEDYPHISTIGFSGGETKTLTITIQASVGTYKYQLTGGSLSGAQTISAGSYQDVDTSTASNADTLKIKFPTGGSYTDGDAWTYTITKEIDVILKSAVGKRYGFPNLQYIDVELPGTGITAMYPAGDRLFVFSDTTLTVVNVAQDYEFLEGTFQGYGVASPKQVVEVSEGIAFVNSTGVYYFDGNKVESLSDDLMMTFNSAYNGWADATNIGYHPQEKLICVWYDSDGGSAADAMISYSLVTKSWVNNSVTSIVGPDTRIKFYNNIPYWLIDGTPDVLKKLTLADTAGDTVSIETGKISCGDLSRYKKFIKVLVTVNNGLEFEIYYKIDSGSWSDATDLDTDGTSDVSIDQKGKTIQFKIKTDDDPDTGTEISDITLVYRDLRID